MSQALAHVSLDDKYLQPQGRVLLSGNQALVRLLLLQRQLDLAAGLNTAGFVSGYRGSPLGGFVRELWANMARLKESHVVFQPGVNEDLAATAIWGRQQAVLLPGAKYDGVFSIWYGKGPGVDRRGVRHSPAARSSSRRRAPSSRRRSARYRWSSRACARRSSRPIRR